MNAEIAGQVWPVCNLFILQRADGSSEATPVKIWRNFSYGTGVIARLCLRRLADFPICVLPGPPSSSFQNGTHKSLNLPIFILH
jgi:hypothetical protein